MTDQTEILEAKPIEDQAIKTSIVKVQGEIAAFDKIAAGIAAIELQHPKDLAVDVTTTAGMKTAIAARAAWRDPRIAVEKARKAAKAPVLELGKQIDAFAGTLELRLREGEDNYDSQIKAEEARKEAEKAARAEAGRKRIAAIQDRIANDITGAVRGAVGRPSSDIGQILGDIDAIVIGADFEEFQGQAQLAKDDATDKLREMQAEAQARADAEARVAREAEEQRIAAERAELRRQQEESEAQRRAEEEAKHAADKRLRDAAPAMLAALKSVRASGAWADIEDHIREAIERAVEEATGQPA